MLRSRSISTVLSRASGDGIHCILLVDADGELLGSYGHHPPPPPPPVPVGTFGSHPPSPVAGVTDMISSANRSSMNNCWPPLDAASIGALISEVAGDYRRMGEELLFLDPLDIVRHSSSSENESGSQDGRGHILKRHNQLLQMGDGDKEVIGSNSRTKSEKEKDHSDSGVNLKSLVIELDHGVVGVSSAGPDFYVIALADTTVQHGSLVGRLKSLGSHFREALSQLD